MSEFSSFFNSNLVDGVYDRLYDASDYAKTWSSIIGNGTIGETGAVSAGDGMSVNLAVTKAFINGYFYMNDEEKALTVDLCSANKRIDYVVIGLSLVDRAITAYIKKGTEAASPVAPELTRDDSTWEIAVASITIDSNTTAITASMIDDLRYDTDICGISASLVKETDFSEFEAKFDEWFKNLKNQLDDNQAAHLQAEIDAINAKTWTQLGWISIYNSKTCEITGLDGYTELRFVAYSGGAGSMVTGDYLINDLINTPSGGSGKRSVSSDTRIFIGSYGTASYATSADITFSRETGVTDTATITVNNFYKALTVLSSAYLVVYGK